MEAGHNKVCKYGEIIYLAFFVLKFGNKKGPAKQILIL